MLPESQFCLSLCPEYSEGRGRNSWASCPLQALLTQAFWRSRVFNDPLSVYLTQFIPFACQSFPFPSSRGWGDCLPSQLINFSKQQRTFQTLFVFCPHSQVRAALSGSWHLVFGFGTGFPFWPVWVRLRQEAAGKDSIISWALILL